MKADSFAVLHLAGGESRALALQVGVSLLQRRLPLRLLRNHLLLPAPHHHAQPTIRTELLLTHTMRKNQHQAEQRQVGTHQLCQPARQCVPLPRRRRLEPAEG